MSILVDKENTLPPGEADTVIQAVYVFPRWKHQKKETEESQGRRVTICCCQC